jgi:membrane-associated phospholipid phosphatase
LEKIIRKSSIIWISVLIYLAATELIILFKEPKLFLSGQFIFNRAVILGIFIVSYFLNGKIRPKLWILVTVVGIYASLTLLYKLVILALLFRNHSEKLEAFGFVLITSFLIYYLIFILVPAVGPQFYFEYPENTIEAQGIFGYIIKLIQENGEVPTGAFPSSHVGIALIMLIWLGKHLKKYLKYFIPFVFLLILATVYIKAHFAVDIIAGILSAPIVYFISTRLHRKISSNYGYNN